MKKKLTGMTIAVMALLLAAIPLTGCNRSNATVELGQVEINEYQGQDLSSVNDFRNNAIKGTQYVDIDTYRLTVKGLVNTPLELTYDEVLNNYQSYKKVVTLHCVEGWDATILWEGFLMRDLLIDAGLSANASYVILRAPDGYSTGLPVSYFMDNDIIVAYKMNDVTMPPERGYPFELVAESKWGYKWIRWLTSIELTDIPYYGFWETKGYNQDADLDKYFYDWLD